MLFKRKKREDSDWWKAFKCAEELYKDGCTHEGKDDIGCRIFKHAEGGERGYCGFNYQFDHGMLDYIEHRKLNKELYND